MINVKYILCMIFFFSNLLYYVSFFSVFLLLLFSLENGLVSIINHHGKLKFLVISAYFQTLTKNSAAGVSWLESHGLELPVLSQCGGHSAARTHRPVTGAAGGYITLGLLRHVKKYAKTGHCKIIKQAKLTRILKDDTYPHHVNGVQYVSTKDGTKHTVYGSSVIIATGGFSYNRDMLRQYAPHAVHVSTTNGPWATGEAMTIARDAGASLKDMSFVQVEFFFCLCFVCMFVCLFRRLAQSYGHCTRGQAPLVSCCVVVILSNLLIVVVGVVLLFCFVVLLLLQIHPTGFIDVEKPHEREKTLAAECLRAAGALLINEQGHRFTNELGHRDDVTSAENGQPGKIRLILNPVAVSEVEPHVRMYTNHFKVLRIFKNGKELAEEMNIPVSNLKDTFETYNQSAKKGWCPSGKNRFPGAPYHIDQELRVGFVEPVLHYVMGGIEIDTAARVKFFFGHAF